jgi:hypothetical protein
MGYRVPVLGNEKTPRDGTGSRSQKQSVVYSSIDHRRCQLILRAESCFLGNVGPVVAALVHTSKYPLGGFSPEMFPPHGKHRCGSCACIGARR